MDDLLSGIEGLIFELDSVLFDKSDWVLPATEFAAQQMRLDPQRALEIAGAYIAQHGGADPQIYNAILLGCGQFDTAMNIRAFTSLINQFQPASRSIGLYPGVEEALQQLRGVYRLSIVTDGPPDTQKRKVIALGLNEIVGTVIYSDDIDGIRSRLPDPRPLLMAAGQLRLKPEALLFVGHNPIKHFQRTREIGFVTVRVLSGEYGRMDYPSEDHRADFDLSSSAGLLELLPLSKLTQAGLEAGDPWASGSLREPPVAAAAHEALAAADLPAGTTFEDAAFAELFQMTSGIEHTPPAQQEAPAPLAAQAMTVELELPAMPAVPDVPVAPEALAAVSLSPVADPLPDPAGAVADTPPAVAEISGPFAAGPPDITPDHAEETAAAEPDLPALLDEAALVAEQAEPFVLQAEPAPVVDELTAVHAGEQLPDPLAFSAEPAQAVPVEAAQAAAQIDAPVAELVAAPVVPVVEAVTAQVELTVEIEPELLEEEALEEDEDDGGVLDFSTL